MANKKFRSIQSKLLFIIIPTVILFLFTIAYITFNKEKKDTTTIIEESSIQVVKARAFEISTWIKGLENELICLSQFDVIRSGNWEIMDSTLKSYASIREHDFAFLLFAELDGTYYTTVSGKATSNISDRGYFKNIVEKGMPTSISNPIISRSTGKKLFNISVPVRNNKEELIGVLVGSVDIVALSEITGTINIGERGYGWILDNMGVVVAHQNENLILKRNLFEYIENDYNLVPDLIDLIKKGKQGSGHASRPNEGLVVVYTSPINNSNNWSLNVSIPEKQVMESSRSLLITTVIAYALGVVIMFFLIIFPIKFIVTNQLNKLVKYTEKVTQGDLSANMDELNNDEIGILASALLSMNDNLKKVVIQIRETASEVTTSSGQNKSASELLSEGASQQAASIEEISSTMEEIASNIQQNSDNALQTERIAIATKNGIEDVSDQSIKTVEASKNIAEKINIINDIAFQTNILALNAAVEAARAGEQGRGFAVVAAEVRKLAERSKIAADDIVKLTNDSHRLAEEAKEKLAKIFPDVEKNTFLIQEISSASQEQNNGVSQVNNAIQQLNSVTTQNASSSEEMAANANSMDSLAKELLNLVDFFTVADESPTFNKNKTPHLNYTKESKIVETPPTQKPEPDVKKHNSGTSINLNDIADDNEFESF